MNLTPVRSLTALLVAILVTSGGLYAQDDSIIEQLNLSAQQREQVKKLRDQFRSETEEVRGSIKQLQKEVRSLKTATPINEAALEAKLKQQAAAEIQLSLAITRFQEKIESLLTPDQKRLLKRLQSGG
jgi:Spy/CpxP family protein refolding chaperone